MNQGLVAAAAGHLGQADRLLREALLLFEEMEDGPGRWGTLLDLGLVLLDAGEHERARRVLARIGGKEFAENQLHEIGETITSGANQVNLTELLHPRLFRILMLGVFLAVFQQWCGINVVFNYAQEIFAAAGCQVSDILFNIVVTGATTFVFTFVAIFLVDRLGRRPLMLAGAIGLALTYITLGFSYYFGLRGIIVLSTVVIAGDQ